MTNVVQCSLMQNNESGSEWGKKKEKREKTYHLQAQAHTHTKEQKNETNKKERKIKLQAYPFLNGILCNAPASRSPEDKKTG